MRRARGGLPLALLATMLAGCAGGAARHAAPAGTGAPASPRDTARASHAGTKHGASHAGRAGVTPLPAGHSGEHLLRLPRGVTLAALAGRSPRDIGPPLATPAGFGWPAPWTDEEALSVPPGALRRDRDSSLVVDSLEMWRERTADPALREPALLRWAGMLLAGGDTLRADSALAVGDLAGSVWAWEALRVRVAIAAARGDTVAADTLLVKASRRGWPEADFAAHTFEAAKAALARGDTVRALRRALDCVERFPALAPSSGASRLLDSLTAVRRDSLPPQAIRAQAEVDAQKGAWAPAARRLEALVPHLVPEDVPGVEFRIGELWRRARRWDDANRALAVASSAAPDSNARARVQLEIARTLRDAGRSDAALAAFDRADAWFPSAALAEAIRWEKARELQDLGRFAEAERAFVATAGVRSRRADEARALAGLMAFLDRRPDVALERWDGNPLESARFWRGVLLRRRGDARGDALLRSVATPPGYGFYAVAARDTLGLRGAPPGLVAARAESDSGPAARVLALARSGMFDDALALANRRAGRDPRLGAAPVTPGEALAWAKVAQMAGRPSRVVAFAQRALREADGMPDSVQWAILPWAFPPAWDSLVTAESDSLGLEPALVFATMRQESVFDPDARSVSSALGLMQLLLPAAQDAARWGREPKPTGEAPLLDPVTNMKWGTRYLARQIARFDGSVTAGLSAYNAGPSTLPPFWKDLVARGGEALFCEVASNADAQTYAKRIVGYRGAYRELAPHAVPPR